jgi:hypothetical protein
VKEQGRLTQKVVDSYEAVMKLAPHFKAPEGFNIYELRDSIRR